MNNINTRFVIIDANHLAHRFNNGMGNRLSHKVNGQVCDTTIATGMLKAVWRYSGFGAYPTTVCLDAPGKSRKILFQEMFTESHSGRKEDGYKGDRSSAGGALFDGLNMFKAVAAGSVNMVQMFDYEADDLIMASIQRIQELYGREVPIDVITNDSDLLPLVDEQVSVFLRSMQGTYAERTELERTKYIQFTPRNFEEQVARLSAYRPTNEKYIPIPYNAILLHKVLRGDESDNIPGDKRAFSPKRMDGMYRVLAERGQSLRFGNWEGVRDFIKEFLTEEEYEKYMPRIWTRYVLSDLNQPIRSLKQGVILRNPVRVVEPQKIDESRLRSAAMQIGVNLPIG